jgi:seryl-tRNA synthetase
MLDLQYIRDNHDTVQEKSKQKNVGINIGELLSLDEKHRRLLNEVESVRAERNELSGRIKQGNATEEQIAKGRELKEHIAQLEEELKPIGEQFISLLKQVPNMPLDDVPIGQSEEDNVVAEQWGEKPKFDFEPKNHAEIAKSKGWLDKERGAKVAGARFVYLKGDLVLLEYALWQFGLSVLTNKDTLGQIIAKANLDISSKPFIPVLPPAVAKTDVFMATGRLNKEEQTYKLEDDDLWLNASAEHTLAPMHMNEILSEADFPIRYVGHTTAFRREAGTYGKDMEGFLRLHQFNKLEMESFNLGERSMQEHLFLIAIQEYLMQQLGLPYQVLNKCTADIGFPNARGVDIEAWLPSQNRYRETHTADYITDFQARGTNTRVKRIDGRIEFVHNNDATAFSQRPLIAIIENYQTKDGEVGIPEVLRPFMGGREQI